MWLLLFIVVACAVALLVSMNASSPKSGGGELTLHVQEPWFKHIRNGSKTIEGRTSPIKNWIDKVGKTVILTNGKDQLHATICSIAHYDTLDEYLAQHWKDAAPQAQSIEEAREHYESVMMKSREDPNDGQPNEKGLIQVFSPHRVKSRGGITAIKISLS